MTTPTHYRYRVLALLVLVSFVSYVLRYLMSAAAPSLVQEYGFTEQQLGWILGAFALSYGLMQFPAGVWADRVGARRAVSSQNVEHPLAASELWALGDLDERVGERGHQVARRLGLVFAGVLAGVVCDCAFEHVARSACGERRVGDS